LKNKITITIATGNPDKVSEIKEIIDNRAIDWKTMSEAGFTDDIVEDGSSYIANALIKARTVHSAVGGWVLADDSGLSVDVLDGAPGIYSARFAGETASYKDKIACLHALLAPWPQQKWQAAFVCAIALISPDGQEWTVEERSSGMIAARAAGDNGFGYDPIFYVPEFGCTMAEMSSENKHAISHRGKALRSLLDIIKRERLFDYG
jgi:XTP/dITP diphosphohydrolase